MRRERVAHLSRTRTGRSVILAKSSRKRSLQSSVRSRHRRWKHGGSCTDSGRMKLRGRAGPGVAVISLNLKLRPAAQTCCNCVTQADARRRRRHALRPARPIRGRAPASRERLRLMCRAHAGERAHAHITGGPPRGPRLDAGAVL